MLNYDECKETRGIGGTLETPLTPVHLGVEMLDKGHVGQRKALAVIEALLDELERRLAGVLTPAPPCDPTQGRDGGGLIDTPNQLCSPLVDRLFRLRDGQAGVSAHIDSVNQRVQALIPRVEA